MRKHSAPVEVLNDINGDLVCLYRVIYIAKNQRQKKAERDCQKFCVRA